MNLKTLAKLSSKCCQRSQQNSVKAVSQIFLKRSIIFSKVISKTLSKLFSKYCQSCPQNVANVVLKMLLDLSVKFCQSFSQKLSIKKLRTRNLNTVKLSRSLFELYCIFRENFFAIFKCKHPANFFSSLPSSNSTFVTIIFHPQFLFNLFSHLLK